MGSPLFRAVAAVGIAATSVVPAPADVQTPTSVPPWKCPKDQVEIQCDGEYGAHLQGIATDRVGAIYWTFTITLVKTDLEGRVLKTATSLFHLGDPAYHDGKVYVPTCIAWDRPNADSRVYVYDAEDLSLLDRRPVPEVTYGAGGIEYYDGRFFIVGGIAPDAAENLVYEYDRDFRHIRTYSIPSGNTSLGVQTISHFDGHFWLGCYGNVLLKLDDACRLVGTYRFDAGYGLEGWEGADALVAFTPYREEGNTKHWRAVAYLAHADATAGLRLYRSSP